MPLLQTPNIVVQFLLNGTLDNALALLQVRPPARPPVYGNPQ